MFYAPEADTFSSKDFHYTTPEGRQSRTNLQGGVQVVQKCKRTMENCLPGGQEEWQKAGLKRKSREDCGQKRKCIPSLNKTWGSDHNSSYHCYKQMEHLSAPRWLCTLGSGFISQAVWCWQLEEGWTLKYKGHKPSVSRRIFPKAATNVILILHWPELSLMATITFRGSWEM